MPPELELEEELVEPLLAEADEPAEPDEPDEALDVAALPPVELDVLALLDAVLVPAPPPELAALEELPVAELPVAEPPAPDELVEPASCPPESLQPTPVAAAPVNTIAVKDHRGNREWGVIVELSAQGSRHMLGRQLVRRTRRPRPPTMDPRLTPTTRV